MARITWDKTGERFYETGVSQGVFYKQVDGTYPVGVPWNGLTAFNESPSGAEPSPLYADDIKYLNLMSAEEYGYSISAYTYPEEFEECEGVREIAPGVVIGQQTRVPFGFSCKTLIGNDTKGTEHGYKLHIAYNSLAGVAEKNYTSVNDNPEAIEFSWECSTTPVEVEGFKPTASLTIDSTRVAADKLKQLEDILYGTESEEARLPLPNEIADIFAA